MIGADLRGLYLDNSSGSTLNNVSCDSNTQLPNNLACNAGLLAFNGNSIDDHGNTLDNATSITLEQVYVGYLSSGDNDTFAFSLPADNKTTIEFYSQIPPQALPWKNGTQVISNRDNTSSSGHALAIYQDFQFDNLTSGNYVLSVMADNSSQNGIYAVFVKTGDKIITAQEHHVNIPPLIMAKLSVPAPITPARFSITDPQCVGDNNLYGQLGDNTTGQKTT